jgi:hypothetical protein
MPYRFVPMESVGRAGVPVVVRWGRAVCRSKSMGMLISSSCIGIAYHRYISVVVSMGFFVRLFRGTWHAL